MFNYETFEEWLSRFFNKKFNELKYSETNLPMRVKRVTIDLSSAPTSPLRVAQPCSSIVAARFYSTAVTTTDKAGTISILFDNPSLANIQNAITMYPNDSYELKSQAREVYFTWSAQSDTSVDLYIYTDISVTPGTTKTQIVGNVSTVPVKMLPPTTVTLLSSVSGSADATRTIPAGYLGIVHVYCIGTSGGAVGYVGSGSKLNSEIIGSYFSGAIQAFPSPVTAKAGEIVTATSTGVDAKCIIRIEEYPV